MVAGTSGDVGRDRFPVRHRGAMPRKPTVMGMLVDLLGRAERHSILGTPLQRKVGRLLRSPRTLHERQGGMEMPNPNFAQSARAENFRVRINDDLSTFDSNRTAGELHIGLHPKSMPVDVLSASGMGALGARRFRMLACREPSRVVPLKPVGAWIQRPQSSGEWIQPAAVAALDCTP